MGRKLKDVHLLDCWCEQKEGSREQPLESSLLPPLHAAVMGNSQFEQPCVKFKKYLKLCKCDICLIHVDINAHMLTEKKSLKMECDDAKRGL